MVKCLYFITNPIISTIVLIGSVCFINGVLFYWIYSRSQWELIFVEDYMSDLLQNIISLVFIIRFHMDKFGDTKVEVMLLIFENIGCFKLIFNSNYSVLVTDMNICFKILTLWQILYPYFIVIMNLIDYMNWKDRKNNSKSLPGSRRIFTFHELLVDTNNNFLPIYIAHSLIIINFSFPFATFELIVYAYKISILLLKFYCIYGYVLYEINSIEYYNWTYDDVNCNNESRSIFSVTKHGQNIFLLIGIGLCIGIDLLYIGTFYISACARNLESKYFMLN